MEIDTKWATELFFTSASFLQVYFEAIANALDAGATHINVVVDLEGSPHRLKALSLEVTDDGEGFTDERFDRFSRLQEPQDQFHKGLGRLVYLRYFEQIRIESTYSGKVRTFTFSKDFNGEFESRVAQVGLPRTTLRFSKFLPQRLHQYNHVSPAALKVALIDQFLPLLHGLKKRGRELEILIESRTSEREEKGDLTPDIVRLSLADLPQLEEVRLAELLPGRALSVHIHLASGQSKPRVLTAVDIDGRAVPLRLLGPKALPPQMSGTFLFESPMFTGQTDGARQRLVLAEGVDERALHRHLVRELSRVLTDRVPEIVDRNAATAKDFERDYPHLVGLFDLGAVGLIDKEDALETARERFFRQQREVLEGNPTSEATFQTSLEVSARALAEYVLYRNWVIKRLQAIKPGQPESVVHNLIVPQRTQATASRLIDDLYRSNAWVLDDRFMTYRTVLSEMEMYHVIEAITLEDDKSGDDGRPDIAMVFSGEPFESGPVDVVVVELKRRRPDEREATYAPTQLVKRARRIVDYCKNVERAWYYAVVELDGETRQILKDQSWIPLFSKGDVFYREHRLTRSSDGRDVLVPMTVLSFDAVVSDAFQRNHAFLELLTQTFRRTAEATAGAERQGLLNLPHLMKGNPEDNISA